MFCSSKYPKSEEDDVKSVEYYDVQKIIAMATKNIHIYKKYEIYIIVPNKKHVLKKVQKANRSSEYITEHLTREQDWTTLYLLKKENLTLRFHQEMITQKTSCLIQEGNKSFLWGLIKLITT